MKFIIITLFPEMFSGILSESILKRAQEKGIFEVEFVNLRDFGIGPRKQVDDTPYGGGAGMVIRVDVMARAIEHARYKIQNTKYKKTRNSKLETRNYKIILLTPQGGVFSQPKAKEFAEKGENLILICGHYEGFDERIRSLVDEEISVGDYVLTGGEIPAMTIIDSVARLIPGVLGKEESHQDESHSEEGRIEYPHYTRPEIFEDKNVPDVLLSGNHAEIAKWREKQSMAKSKKVSPF